MVRTPHKATYPQRPESSAVSSVLTPGALPQRVNRTILDTYFLQGVAFLEAAQAWLCAGPGVLHYVALCNVDDLSYWRHRHTTTSALQAELYAACASALPGIQRLLLAQGRISLTLCAGPLQNMLAEQVFLADEVRVPFARSGPIAVGRWDKWSTQLLARRCRRGTVLRICAEPIDGTEFGLQALKAQWLSLGFDFTDDAKTDVASQGLRAIYAPRWTLRTTRSAHQTTADVPQRCAVVGAGLAGASVAHALALRGWQVTVLDSGDHPARGASGLPVGLVVPHVSVDDSPRSRMSRVGARLTLEHAQRLLCQGDDWSGTGVLEFDADADRVLAASGSLLEAGWLQTGALRVPHADWGAGRPDARSLWHCRAGWIKPARLVAAWLAQPGIRVLCKAQVARLQRDSGVWQLRDTQGTLMAEAEIVVVANAMGALPLLESLDAAWALPLEVHDKLQSLQALHGTVSHGSMPNAAKAAFPLFAVNGNGSLVANVPSPQGLQWYAGATYETDASQLQHTCQQHAANLSQLNTLMPAVATTLKAQFSPSQPHQWTGTRCVSHDRLPLVGPAHADASSGLWLSIAMGSRGLSFAALCAELLAARLGGEPFPIETRLAKSLDIHRPRRQRKQG